jgi:hypothetical protein
LWRGGEPTARILEAHGKSSLLLALVRVWDQHCAPRAKNLGF